MGDWTAYQIGLAAMMLITGSINTLSTKWADQSYAIGSTGNLKRPFDHPFVQATFMFLGEVLCLFVFFCVRCKQRSSGPLMEGAEPTSPRFNLFVFLPAALCDMFATSIMYIGLNLTYASSFQMLRGAVVLFTALLSVAFLGRKITCHMWLGMSFILFGLAMVGISDIVFGNATTDKSDKNAIIAGDLLIILAQIITAAQMVYEEKVVSKYNVHPLNAVGLEGLFGFIILGLLLIPMYFIIAGRPFTNDPEFRLENAIDAFYQMKNNWVILVAMLGNVLSIAFFNFSGISVTKEISATTRMVLDSCRTIVIWVVSLGVGWQSFALNSFFTQLGGFILLFFGMCLYNDIIFAPFLRSCGCLKGQAEGEDMQPILDQTDNPDDEDDVGYRPSGPVTAGQYNRQQVSPNIVYS